MTDKNKQTNNNNKDHAKKGNNQSLKKPENEMKIELNSIQMSTAYKPKPPKK